MTGEEISSALGSLPEDLILEAMAPRRHAANARVPWKRLAAWAAVMILVVGILLWSTVQPPNIVEAEGILTVTAYSSDGISSQVLEEGIDLPWDYHWNMSINSLLGLPLNLSLPEEQYPNSQIQFEIFVDEGSFQMWDNVSFRIPEVIELGQFFAVHNHTTIYWWNVTPISGHSDGGYEYAHFTGESAFVDIIIKADDHIVGYAIIEIYKSAPESDSYRAKILRSVSFPSVQDTFQEVGQEYVEAEIKRIHR